MKFTALKSGSRLEIQNHLSLEVFEEIYPFNEVTGRALFKVRDRKTQLFYALKTFALELNDEKEIQREILSLNNYDFGSVVPKCRWFSVARDHGMLLMDWVEGRNMAQRYSSPPEDFYAMRERIAHLQGLCIALDKLHARKIFHRDLKPENIIISLDRGAEEKINLIDFGMVNVRRGQRLCEGSSFRAPEQDGRRDFNLMAQVDIFSVGKIGWWLLTGTNPQLFENEETFADWDNLDSLSLSDGCPIAPKSLELALKGALAYQPEKRYRSAKQFEFALKNCKLKEGKIA